MSSFQERVASVKLATLHAQLAVAQETPDGSAKEAIYHYLKAMELLEAAGDLSHCHLQPYPSASSVLATEDSDPCYSGEEVSSVACTLSEPILPQAFQSVVVSKIKQYMDRVRLLLEVEGLVLSTDGKGTVG
eukprot:Tbor_TRINITY_DN5010_c5_g2::TRINITY_DN5010_c5_g2_i1::g.14101::m.14101